MYRIKITTDNDKLFASFWEIYEYSFPLCERRSLEDQQRIFNLNNYHLEAWVKDDTILGFIGWWDLDDLRYVEHYAINIDYRSEGYGSKFLKEWLRTNNKQVLLEIEPVEDEITLRRQNFYHRLNFVDSNIRHWHPPYHKGLDRVDLWLLTYPNSLDEEVYQRFHNTQKEVIIPIR
ncbi:hypothetical protein M2138_001027 [Dysgonomonadaceae bacterium PH5-43]|nr:hypothetical protein [Dysgonomonadaceae bacterium PH5-43]